jgi:hypothetical protein
LRKAWENDKTVFPPFPQTLEIAPRFPHSLPPAADNLYPIFKTQKEPPQLPNPLTFRLIFQLEKTEREKKSLVTMTALCLLGFCQDGQILF